MDARVLDENDNPPGPAPLPVPSQLDRSAERPALPLAARAANDDWDCWESSRARSDDLPADSGMAAMSEDQKRIGSLSPLSTREPATSKGLRRVAA